MKRLIAYFSATGTTKRVGNALANLLNADTYEIKPVNPYTKEDLNWMDKQSRSTIEMKNKTTSRPEIIKDGLDLSKYDEILIGYPVWWYTAPTIINTFLEAYNFDDKHLILWATSGSSGLGSSKEDLSRSTKAKITNGRILRSNKDIEDFANSVK